MPSIPNVACVSTFMCHPDEDEALRRGLEGANFFGYSLAHYYIFGRHRPGTTDVWAEYERRRGEHGFDPTAVAAAAQHGDRLGAKVVQGGIAGIRGAVGTPAQIRDYLRRYEEAGVDQVIFVSQAGKNRHEHIMESLELFGREVLPEFKDARSAPSATKPPPGAGDRAGDGAQARRRPPAAADARLRLPRDPARRSRPRRLRRLPPIPRQDRRGLRRSATTPCSKPGATAPAERCNVCARPAHGAV